MNSTSASYAPPENTRELVLAWLRRARESQMTHYEMANIFSLRERWLGVPVIFLTSVIGTSVFASLATQVIDHRAKILVGMLSVVAAVLSSLQTFFKYSERSEKHRSCAAKFASIRRELETIYAENSVTTERRYIDTLRDRLDSLADEAPHVPAGIFKKIQNNLYCSDQQKTSANQAS